MAKQFDLAPNVLAEAFVQGDPFANSKLLEQDNIATVQRIITALSVGDIAGFTAELDPEIELEIFCPYYFPWIRQAKGIDEILSAVKQNFGVLENQTPIINSLVAQGDMVDLSAEETGKIRGTGYEYSITGLLQYKLKDGKVISLREIISDRATSTGA